MTKDDVILTVFCAFTRRWALDRWIEGFRAVDHDPSRVNLCFIVDTDEPGIKLKLQRMADEHGYRSCHIEVNSHHQPNEVRVSARRKRIADIKTQSKRLIRQTDGQYIVCFEDDTVFNGLKCFCRLVAPLMDDPTVGFVEGVQVGRWGVKIIGAWDIKEFSGAITEARTITQGEHKGYQPITAGGFYGYATRRSLYLQHHYHSSDDEPWGPDVNFGLYVQRRGFKSLIDWDTVFGHNDHNVILYPDEKVTSIVFNNTPDGEWIRGDV